jgi:uncharacterized protein (DUF2336 family)
MIIRQFLEWFTVSKVEERVEAAQAFCDAFIQRVPDIINHPDSEAVLTLILDDPSLDVRYVLAESFAGFEHAPRHIIIGLANQCSDISIPVLGRSLLLTDADLIDCLGVGNDAVQSAIALRGEVSAPISSALADFGCFNAVDLLLKNSSAVISSSSLTRIAERFGNDNYLRELLLQRDDLPVAVRYSLVVDVSADLIKFIESCGLSEGARARRLITDVNEQATIMLSKAVGEHQDLELVEALRCKKQLTPALLLRSLLCAHLSLFEAALSLLAQVPIGQIHSLLRQKNGTSFVAIYRRAKMPEPLELAFKTAYLGACEAQFISHANDKPALSRIIISKVLLVIAQENSIDHIKLMGLLRRLESDSIRIEAKNISAQILSTAEPIQLEAEYPHIQIDFKALECELLEFSGDNKNTNDLNMHDSKLSLKIAVQDDESGILDLENYKIAA